jgi:hypothetical protein
MKTQRYFQWPANLRRSLLSLLVFFLCLTFTQPAIAFCGFFVGRSEAKLNNSASRVVIVREGDKSTFLMANNFQGDVKDFARIVPIPVIPKREQVRIGDNKVIDQLDAFTAPRLAEYVDNLSVRWSEELKDYGNILLGIFFMGLLIFCMIPSKLTIIEKFVILVILGILLAIAAPSFFNQANKAKSSSTTMAAGSSVNVVDQFSVGEYDVALLDAEESNGLATWLASNGYKMPQGAETMLNSYIQQGMKFFVVKINSEAFQKAGQQFLRPIIIEYNSPKFMLPMRLGTLNATADQDLTVYILARDQFAEVANYPTVTIPTDAVSNQRQPSGQELPSSVKNNFGEFYQAVFQKAYEDAGKSAAFLEFAGPIGFSRGSCDPCSMKPDEMVGLQENLTKLKMNPSNDDLVIISRLHVRYNQQTFPKDLEFRLGDPEKLMERLASEGKLFRSGTLFQGRYVIRTTKGLPQGFSGWKYRQQLGNPKENLARLTGWSAEKINGDYK